MMNKRKAIAMVLAFAMTANVTAVNVFAEEEAADGYYFEWAGEQWGAVIRRN